MLSFFRTNQAYAGLLLFVYALVLWLPYFLAGAPPVSETSGNGVLGEWLTDMLGAFPLAAFCAAVLLTGIQGIQANTWATRYHLSRTVTQFPGLFVVLTTSLVADAHSLHAFLAANIMVLFALLSLGRLYKRDEPAVALFNAGAWLGMASLFRPEYLLFLPAVAASVGILRHPGLRLIFQLLTGLLLIYFFGVVAGYSTGQLTDWSEQQFSHFGWPKVSVESWYNLTGLSVMGVLLLGVILSFGRIGAMLNIEGSKNIQVLAWLLLLSGLVILFSGNISPLSSQAAVVPLGILLGLWITKAQAARAEAIHLVLLVASLLPLFFIGV